MFFLTLYDYPNDEEVYGIAVTPSSEANWHYISCGIAIMTEYISFTELRDHGGKEKLPCMEFDEQDGYLIRLV